MLPHDFDFTTVIPQAQTFKWITKLHKDWLKDSSSVNIAAVTRWTKQQGDISDLGGIKALIVSIVCQWPEFANEYMKLYSQQNGYDKEDFKKIIAYAMQHSSEFESLRQKYCMPSKSQSTTTSPSSRVSIKYPKNTSSNFYRLTIYDPKYQPPARRHIYLGKKVGNIYKVYVGGATVTSWYNEPFFDSVTQAEAFINNVGNLQLINNPITYEYTITDKPILISGLPYNCISDLTHCVLVDTECGPAYIHKQNEKCVESLEVELEEDIEKHDNLNPVIFDGDKLRPEVREQSLLIIEEFLKMLEDFDISIDVKDIVLTGSNASYNYTKDSDIDIHIIADTSKYKDTNKLYPVIYDAYKSLFNKKFEIKFYNIPIELYVENQDTPVVSNGIYSIKDNKWIKEPELLDIPEIDLDKVNEAVKPWEDEALDLIKKAQSGELEDELPIDDYISRLYELRHKGFKSEGEYSTENLVFKEIRNNGYLDELKDLKNQIIAKRLSLN